MCWLTINENNAGEGTRYYDNICMEGVGQNI